MCGLCTQPPDVCLFLEVTCVCVFACCVFCIVMVCMSGHLYEWHVQQWSNRPNFCQQRMFGTLGVAVMTCTDPVVAECLHVQHMWHACVYVCASCVRVHSRPCADVGARACLLWSCGRVVVWSCVWMLPSGPCQCVAAVSVCVCWCVVRASCVLCCLCSVFGLLLVGAVVS